jgi:hypothetical protein
MAWAQGLNALYTNPFTVQKRLAHNYSKGRGSGDY